MGIVPSGGLGARGSELCVGAGHPIMYVNLVLTCAAGVHKTFNCWR